VDVLGEGVVDHRRPTGVANGPTFPANLAFWPAGVGGPALPTAQFPANLAIWPADVAGGPAFSANLASSVGRRLLTSLLDEPASVSLAFTGSRRRWTALTDEPDAHGGDRVVDEPVGPGVLGGPLSVCRRR
jgi:hypothetical protein